jgi:hypothetical protein
MDKVCWVTVDPTVTKATDIEGVGRLRWYQNQCYRWVKNSTGGALTAGRAYYFGTANTLGLFAEIFTFGQSTKGTAINLLAGIAMSAVNAGEYGWVLVYGVYATAGVEGTAAVAATDHLKGVSGQTYLVKDVAAGTAPTTSQRVIALAAQGSAGVAATSIFINVL